MIRFIIILFLFPLSVTAQQSWQVITDSTGTRTYVWQEDGRPLTIEELSVLQSMFPQERTGITTAADAMSFFNGSAICFGLSVLAPFVIAEVAPSAGVTPSRWAYYGITGGFVGLGILFNVMGTQRLQKLIPVASKDGVGIGLRLE